MNSTSTDTSSIRVHSTAIVDPKAEIDVGVTIGPYSIIEANVRIGKNCRLGPHVILRRARGLA
jgi:UDP-N-acetylglucosamine acyltransferase